MRRQSLPLLVWSVVFGMALRGAEPTKVELHVVQTMTLTDEQFLRGARDGRPVAIAGELRIPQPGTERLPAVVIMHGSSGIGAIDVRWARELNDMGIATFALDGFTTRGIAKVAADQSQLGTLTSIYDSYRALELLARHPRIDPARIGIMGFSRGGRVALYASLQRFQRTYAAPGTQFALHLPFYAGCYTTYVDDLDVGDRPIRLFHGTADDTAPVALCRAYVRRLQDAGKDVVLTEYAGAHHGFDYPGAPTRRFPDTQVAGRACALYEDKTGRILNRDTDFPFTWSDRCVERGGTVGYDAAAHAQAIKDVRAVLQRVFRLASTP